MRCFLLILVVTVTLGCSNSVSKEDLKQLNGYWEIDVVEFPNGQQKEYVEASTTIDYFELNGTNGFRKKVYPKLDGTFDTSNDAEPFKIVENDGRFSMQYQNEMSEWVEEVLHIDPKSFSVKNQEGIIYKYRRHEPINISP